VRRLYTAEDGATQAVSPMRRSTCIDYLKCRLNFRHQVIHGRTLVDWLSPTLPTPGDRIANGIQTRPVDSIFIPLDLSYFLLTTMICLDGVLTNVF
jgi:hypothetical protein